jgi:hypothetical protein
LKIESHENKIVGIDGKEISRSVSMTITRDQNNPPDTVWGVVNQILELDKNSPDFKFQVTAKIKRLVHHEKASLLSRLSHYCKDSPEFGIRVINEKLETHKEWALKPDTEIVTWKV